MSQDLAKVAYETWAENIPRGEDEPILLWEELSDEQTRPWIAVESRFLDLRDGDLEAGPQSIDYELTYPLPEIVDEKGRSAAGTKLRKRATKFSIRRPTAADSIRVQEFSEEERDLRLAFACMSWEASRFSWDDFQELDFEDIAEIKAIALAGWSTLESEIYEAWREPAERVADLEVIAKLHPEDVPAFLAFEREHKNRAEVIDALEQRGEAEPADEERWAGEAGMCWTESWTALVRRDAGLKWVWFHVARALARAADDSDSIALFTPGVRRILTPKIDRIRGKEILAMRSASNDEERMLAFAASICAADLSELMKLSLDDFMRVALTAQRTWLPNRQRERGSGRGSSGGKQTSPASPTASEASSPSP